MQEKNHHPLENFEEISEQIGLQKIDDKTYRLGNLELVIADSKIQATYLNLEQDKHTYPEDTFVTQEGIITGHEKKQYLIQVHNGRLSIFLEKNLFE